MYKVFLVDDEIVIREGIRNNFLWEDSGFTLVGEAPDGEIALSMLQDIKPDILLTDIRMPFMDGLELCRRVTSSMPWLHVIILSGFDEFAYAKEAMSLGVHDYLLKPVNAHDLLEALQKTAGAIEERRKQQADLNALREQFATHGQYLKEKLLQDLLGGLVSREEIPAFQERARALQLNLRAPCYMALLVSPQYTERRHLESLAVQMQLRRLASGNGGATHFCECGGSPLLLVMGDTDADLEERGYGVAQAVQRELGDTVGLRTQVSLGRAVRQLWELPDSFATARRVQSTANRLEPAERDSRSILGVDDMPAEAGLSLAELDVLPIAQQLQFVAAEDIGIVLDRYIASLGDNALRSMMMLNYLYVKILLDASQIIKNSGGNPDEVLPPEFQHEERVKQAMSEEDVRPLLERVLRCAVTYRDQRSSSRYGQVIRSAQAFLNEHYQNPGISLHDVANHVALSNNHFCTVFSQETGITFTECLTGLRLSKAKELLQGTRLRTSEIANQIGYNDPHYFSYLFKKHTGVSPREYRQALERPGRKSEDIE